MLTCRGQQRLSLELPPLGRAPGSHLKLEKLELGGAYVVQCRHAWPLLSGMLQSKQGKTGITQSWL